MHFVTGGAYNGKANWVKQHYGIESENNETNVWISAYENVPLSESLLKYNKKVIVLEGIEQWILQLIEYNDETTYLRKIETLFNSWKNWSEESAHKLIIIGTDIPKGIVPIEQKQRMWRDLTGFLYQRIV